MKAGEFAIEVAAYRVDQERDAGVSRVRSLINAQGQLECQDCGIEIPGTRGVAAPSPPRVVWNAKTNTKNT
jgi:hypothetical protein